MKSASILVLFVIITTAYYVNAKALLGIDTNIPIPFVPPLLHSPSDANPTDTKQEASKEVETLDKSESAYFGYYPYYYGWPYYGYRSYPYVYVG